MATPPKIPAPVVTPIVTSATPPVPTIPIVPVPMPPTPIGTPPTTTAGPSVTPFKIALPKKGSTYPDPNVTTLQPATGPVVEVQWDPLFQNLQSLTFGLTVTDSLGVTSANAAQVTVVIQAKPTAGLSGPGIVTAGMPIALDGSTSKGVGLKFNWTLVSTTP
jgi:hypothetical protein